MEQEMVTTYYKPFCSTDLCVCSILIQIKILLRQKTTKEEKVKTKLAEFWKERVKQLGIKSTKAARIINRMKHLKMKARDTVGRLEEVK